MSKDLFKKFQKLCIQLSNFPTSKKRHHLHLIAAFFTVAGITFSLIKTYNILMGVLAIGMLFFYFYLRYMNCKFLKESHEIPAKYFLFPDKELLWKQKKNSLIIFLKELNFYSSEKVKTLIEIYKEKSQTKTINFMPKGVGIFSFLIPLWICTINNLIGREKNFDEVLTFIKTISILIVLGFLSYLYTSFNIYTILNSNRPTCYITSGNFNI